MIFMVILCDVGASLLAMAGDVGNVRDVDDVYLCWQSLAGKLLRVVL
jgi:hypothetical protein